MATALAKIERIDARRPLATLSLPAWLQRSVSGLTVGWEDVTRADGAKARMRVWTIARSLSPTAETRRAIESRISDLSRILAAVDVDVALARVTEMLLAFPMPAGGQSAATARARGYIAALDDLPSWAVSEACRRWLRGDAGDGHNYAFSPTPPVLRRIAESAVVQARVQLDKLEQLLEAKVVEDPQEFSDEHCAKMRTRLAELLRRHPAREAAE